MSEQRLVRLADIRRGQTHRKDLGDLQPLIASIRELGLLQPVGLNSSMTLVFGNRRLAACERLGKTEIPAVILDTLDDAMAALKAERDENKCRKEMTPSELVEIGRALEELERAEAKKRQEATQPKQGEKVGKQGGGTVPPPSDLGKTRDKVGEALGVSGKSYEAMKKVVDDGVPGLVEAMDQKLVSKQDAATVAKLPKPEQEEVVRQGPQAIKQKAAELKTPAPAPPAEPSPPKVLGKGVELANEAINCLKRIPRTDPLRKRGYEIVLAFIKSNQ